MNLTRIALAALAALVAYFTWLAFAGMLFQYGFLAYGAFQIGVWFAVRLGVLSFLLIVCFLYIEVLLRPPGNEPRAVLRLAALAGMPILAVRLIVSAQAVA